MVGFRMKAAFLALMAISASLAAAQHPMAVAAGNSTTALPTNPTTPTTSTLEPTLSSTVTIPTTQTTVQTTTQTTTPITGNLPYCFWLFYNAQLTRQYLILTPNVFDGLNF